MGFRGAERGQSEVIGALLIFAVIVAFIGLNQAFLVPQANEDVEFKHNNDVQRDMVDLRSGIVEAAASNDQRSRTLSLGTEYPSRFIAINPPPATGSLQTVDARAKYDSSGQEVNGTSVVTRACNTESTSQNPKFLRYTPNYNEFSNGLPINVENTVTYRSTGTGPLFNTQQTVVRGNQINIIRIVGNVNERTTGTVSVDLVPSSTGVREIEVDDEENFSLSIPTHLSNETWADQQLGDNVDEVHDDGDRVTMDFKNGEYTVKCTTVGVNENPDVNPVALSESGNDGSDADLVNPRGDVIFKDATIDSDDGSRVTVELENLRDSTVNISEARFTFYSIATDGQTTPNRDIPDWAMYGGEQLDITGDIQPVNGDEIESESTKSISITFDVEDGDFDVVEGDWFMVFFRFTEQSEDGESFSGTYFIPPED